jgi:hypothetical protein
MGSTAGLKRELFPVGFAGEVMLHIVETWAVFSFDRKVRHETRITALFRDALIETYVAAGRNWFIALEDPITDADFGTELGRNDLRFYPQNHYGQKVFFTVECKRLRVQGKSGLSHLADKYIDEGLLRFVSGRYSVGLPCGGMVGYVMDGNVAEAFATVRKSIDAKARELKMSAKRMSAPSKAIPSYEWSGDTRHNCQGGELAVHHVLVNVVQ